MIRVLIDKNGTLVEHKTWSIVAALRLMHENSKYPVTMIVGWTRVLYNGSGWASFMVHPEALK